MSHKAFQFLCQHCNWRRITDGSGIKDLYEYPTSEVPGGAPQLDPKTKMLPRDKNGNVIAPTGTKQKRKFRCPSCGHAVVPKVVDDPQKNQEEKAEIATRTKERKELEESILNRPRKPNEENRID
jgi:DNA-directed RNA polymerase subunit RPC12/RpoP